MKFKNWLLNEEIYLQNNTAVIYHRTSNLGTVSSMLSEIFKAGSKNGCALGCGLYGVTDLDYQFDIYVQDYGKYITKWKVTGLNEFLILVKDQAAKIHGIDSPVSKQLQKLGVLEDWKKVAGENWQNILAKYDEQPSYKFLEDNPDWVQKNLKGAVYYDSRFGICVLKYPPVEEGVTFLAYAEAPVTGDEAKDQKTKAYLQWEKQMLGTSVKSLYQAKASGRDISDKVVKISPLTLTPANFESHPITFKLSPTNFINTIQLGTANKNSISDYPSDLKQAIHSLDGPPIIFRYAPYYKQISPEMKNKKGQVIDTGMVDEKYQWHVEIVRPSKNIFKVNGSVLVNNAEVPINNNDQLCVKVGSTGKEYCFAVSYQSSTDSKTSASQLSLVSQSDTNKKLTIKDNSELGKTSISELDPEANRFMSPKQFQLKQTKSGWMISHNPEAVNMTTVNGNPLKFPKILKQNDVVALGKTGKVALIVNLQ